GAGVPAGGPAQAVVGLSDTGWGSTARVLAVAVAGDDRPGLGRGEQPLGASGVPHLPLGSEDHPVELPITQQLGQLPVRDRGPVGERRRGQTTQLVMVDAGRDHHTRTAGSRHTLAPWWHRTPKSTGLPAGGGTRAGRV